VVGVVLIAYDPDGLAAFELQALAENLQEEALDIIPAAGLGVELGDDIGAHGFESGPSRGRRVKAPAGEQPSARGGLRPLTAAQPAVPRMPV
jgi:hypothetical protein